MSNFVHYMLLLLFLWTGSSCSYNSQNQSSGSKDSTLKSVSRKEADTIWVSCTGDLMSHGAQLLDAKTGNAYDFTHMFNAIIPYTSFADLTLGNFETVTAGADKNFTGYPTFNTPVEFAEAIKDAGFDVFTTANNHCLDRGFFGIEKTISTLSNLNVYHTGTFAEESEAEKILLVNVKNLKLAILAYSYGTNGINPPSGKNWCVNYISSAKMKRDVEAAKKLGADKIIVCIHWGEEYQRIPNQRQKSVAEELFGYGADIIFGSHPHVIQPMETKTIIDDNGKQKKVFIIWSMGNFISNQRKRYTDSGVIINVRLIKNLITGETIIDKIDYVPTYVSDKNGFCVLPVYESIKAIEDKDTESPYYSPLNYSRLKEVYNETTSHLTNEENGIYPFEGTVNPK
ncbi:MAG: CapA family protein [Ignavibacteriae bacterium]|nr:CapA family protein [Ignavibacteriota bacterium]